VSASNAGRRGCFVTGTDTGVGKTVVAASIVARLRQRGVAVRALKPLITGLEDPPDPVWPRDHELLARVAGATPQETILAGYGPAVSPHLAAELTGTPPPSPSQLAADVIAAGGASETLVIEGVGGLLVPLGPDGDVRDLAVALGLPMVVVARPGLGTINHTLLTLEAARRVGLRVAGVVLTPWPDRPDPMLRSNRETIARIGHAEVATLGLVAEPQPRELAAAGATLPLERWLSNRQPRAASGCLECPRTSESGASPRRD
jgi:dethiobiotin synthetase